MGTSGAWPGLWVATAGVRGGGCWCWWRSSDNMSAARGRLAPSDRSDGMVAPADPPACTVAVLPTSAPPTCSVAGTPPSGRRVERFVVRLGLAGAPCAVGGTENLLSLWGVWRRLRVAGGVEATVGCVARSVVPNATATACRGRICRGTGGGATRARARVVAMAVGVARPPRRCCAADRVSATTAAAPRFLRAALLTPTGGNPISTMSWAGGRWLWRRRAIRSTTWWRTRSWSSTAAVSPPSSPYTIASTRAVSNAVEWCVRCGGCEAVPLPVSVGNHGPAYSHIHKHLCNDTHTESTRLLSRRLTVVKETCAQTSWIKAVTQTRRQSRLCTVNHGNSLSKLSPRV